jgi:glutamyl-tRNA synthetase
LVYGTIKVDNKELDDFIIARSDGSPTYNFVVAIDDSDMNITHVIRGDDHLANTPKQILVYQALGLEIPTFAHLPMILGSDKKRLSKRHAATNVQEYRDKGFTPDTIINYLSMLGWNPDSNKEIFTKKELIKAFKLEQVQKKPAGFDEKKLLWMSGQHIAHLSKEDLMEELQNYKEDEEGFWNTLSAGMGQHLTKGKAKRYRALDFIKDRCKTLDDVAKIGQPLFYFPDVSLDDEVLKDSLPILEDFLSALKISDYKRLTPTDIIKEEMESIFQDLMVQHDVGIGKIMKPIRYALFGLTFGPDLIGSMTFIGKIMVEHRIETLLEGE